MAPRAERPAPERPRVVVVGLGPAGGELMSDEARAVVAGARWVYLRTRRHPAAAAFGDVPSFDHHYERCARFEEVYAAIVEDLVTAARQAARTPEGAGGVVYAVPGSPLVAESTVQLLRHDPRVEVTVLPAISFVDLAWDRLGVDPISAGVRMVDGTSFQTEAAGSAGPLLVAQCWSPSVLSEIKLAVDEPAGATATLLHHLGLPDEQVVPLQWDELDRVGFADHLTSLWIPSLQAPIAREFVALDELARVLRRECPWDRAQTHRSLRRHLLEEAYEVLDAIDELDPGVDDPSGGLEHADHLREELGDLLFQVVIHARLAAEEGRFTLADVARGIADKLVARHPHVFGNVRASSAEEVAANWEVIKAQERARGQHAGRGGPLEGIPSALPALALAAELLRRSQGAVLLDRGGTACTEPGALPEGARPSQGAGMCEDLGGGSRQAIMRQLQDLVDAAWAFEGGPDATAEDAIGRMLLVTCALAEHLGVQPEMALRRSVLAWARQLHARAR